MSSPTESNSGFEKGFVTATLLLAVLAGGVRAAEWVVSHPMPDAIVAWLTRPRLSILGIVQLAPLAVIGCAVIWMVAYGPRFRRQTHRNLGP